MARHATGLRERLDGDMHGRFDENERIQLRKAIAHALDAADGDVELASRMLAVPRGAVLLLIDSEPELRALAKLK